MDLSFVTEFRQAVGKFDSERKAKQTPPQGVVRYDNLGNADSKVKYDVYRSQKYAEQGKLPVIVDIHGGGWIYGDKRLNDIYLQHLADKGFAVVSVDYTLLPDTDLRGQVQDIFTCLTHLPQSAKTLDFLDLDRVYVVGDSAGGHLATIVYAASSLERVREVYGVAQLPYTIKALGLSHPVPDPQSRHTLNTRQRNTVKLLLTDSDLQHNSSWYDIKDLALPPVYLISCGADSLSPLSKKFAKWLKKRKCDYVFDFYPKRRYPHLSHVFDVTYPHYSEAQKSIDDMLQYFLQHSN